MGLGFRLGFRLGLGLGLGLAFGLGFGGIDEAATWPGPDPLVCSAVCSERQSVCSHAV